MTWRSAPGRLFGIALLLALLVGSAAHAQAPAPPAPAAPCDVGLRDYNEDPQSATVTIAILCAPKALSAEQTRLAQRRQAVIGFPLNEPLLLGMSAIATPTEEATLAAQRPYDFPVRNFQITSDDFEHEIVHRVRRSKLAGRTHLVVRVWHASALRPCSGGRPGCDQYGYILETARDDIWCRYFGLSCRDYGQDSGVLIIPFRSADKP